MTTKHFYVNYRYNPTSECYYNNFDETDNYFNQRNYDNQQGYNYYEQDYNNYGYNNYGYDNNFDNWHNNNCNHERFERKQFTCHCEQQNWGWKEDNHNCNQKHNRCEHNEKDFDCGREQKQNCNKKERHNCNCFRCRFKNFFKCC